MIVQTLNLCTFYFVQLFLFYSHFLIDVELRHFTVCPLVCNNLGVPNLCNLYLQKFLFLFIQTLPNNCLHMEDVHLLFCARFTIFFLFLRGVELGHFPSKILRGCLVCVICNSNSIHSFIFKLCIMINNTMKM